MTACAKTSPSEASPESTRQQQQRVLTLNDDEHLDSTLFRLQKGWILQFRLGPSLLGKTVLLYTNHPENLSVQFQRTTYRQLTWNSDSKNKADDTAMYADVPILTAGSFHYYFTYQGGDSDKVSGSGFFLVDPVLTYGIIDEVLPLDCIQCQTVLTKLLGHVDEWEGKLKVAKETGYNMIHFTPIQMLGASNSSYSVADQHKLNPLFSEGGRECSLSDVEKLMKRMRDEWEVLSVSDIVMNHTANESPWLKDHPESTFNLVNSPHLRPPYLLDRLLWHLGLEISEGKWKSSGILEEVTTMDHLNAIRSAINGYFLPQVKIPEFYMMDIQVVVDEFRNYIKSRPSPETSSNETESLKVIQDPEYRRLKSTVDMKLAERLYNKPRSECQDEEERIKKCCTEFQSKLKELNEEIRKDIHHHLGYAVENCVAGMIYFRIQANGPRIKEVSKKNPLVPQYFTHYGSTTSLQEEEARMYQPTCCYIMAHNGWVMNDDPLRNFAEGETGPGSNVYLRRELIAWGDSVKLRYGKGPEDCPYLWQHMKKYAEDTARIFHGIRLDNCHSTPIHVAEYMLDAARSVRPDLYVMAELFTNSDLTDNVFVNRLGITSLIREALAAWNSHEQGRLVFRYGGEPVGAFIQPRLRPLIPSIAHAMFLDLTHDNPSPVEKRSVFDMLPSTALVAMACCATGSNRGYDELVPHHIHVVNEARKYTTWTDSTTLPDSEHININTGIIAAKKAINRLHYELGISGFSQVYVDQMDPDVVAVTRHCPITHRSVVLIAHTAFTFPKEGMCYKYIRPLKVEGVLEEIILEAKLTHKEYSSGGPRYKKPENFSKHKSYINGLEQYIVEVKEHIQLYESEMVEMGQSSNPALTQINLTNFYPGSVIVFRFSLQSDARDAVTKVRNIISSFGTKVHVAEKCPLPMLESSLESIISHLSLADLNRVLYRCDQEERDEGWGGGVYSIPRFGALPYCGLQGFITYLNEIRPKNDLGHPFCDNLRQGNWMMDYIVNRLKHDNGTADLAQWFKDAFQPLREVPRFLIPCYFDAMITGAFIAVLCQVWKLMSSFVQDGSNFVKALTLGSVQHGAYIKSSPLPTLSPNLASGLPPVFTSESGVKEQRCTTMAAGLPHFSVGYMRNWGRDTFIALRGLFIITGRHEEARFIILGFAACLRHGLIPNLLDRGTNARFNCRDAIWWWLQCIQDYVKEVPDGHMILKDKVSRLYPTDDSSPQQPGAWDQVLEDVIQESLQAHFQGTRFREQNAGKKIDREMKDEGFNNEIGVNINTGFVFGGNVHNCGTWMDKMGSSEKAGTKGKPATPRDGSAVELVGLSHSALRWLTEMHREGKFTHSSVQRNNDDGSVTRWTYDDWAQKIVDNFEKYFWINTIPDPEDETKPELINRTGIYKDSHGASQFWADYQLRCNFSIAMVVAPEMFTPQNAWTALKNMESILLGPLGMKTLDPSDWAYNGDYDNSNDTSDSKLARGYNYHQGPEWLWPLGFFLRAKLTFAYPVGGLKELHQTVAFVKEVLSRHFTEVQASKWRGLPELTNTNGKFCRDSNPTQAWSMGCLLEVLYEMDKLEWKE